MLRHREQAAIKTQIRIWNVKMLISCTSVEWGCKSVWKESDNNELWESVLLLTPSSMIPSSALRVLAIAQLIQAELLRRSYATLTVTVTNQESLCQGRLRKQRHIRRRWQNLHSTSPLGHLSTRRTAGGAPGWRSKRRLQPDRYRWTLRRAAVPLRWMKTGLRLSLTGSKTRRRPVDWESGWKHTLGRHVGQSQMNVFTPKGLKTDPSLTLFTAEGLNVPYSATANPEDRRRSTGSIKEKPQIPNTFCSFLLSDQWVCLCTSTNTETREEGFVRQTLWSWV